MNMDITIVEAFNKVAMASARNKDGTTTVGELVEGMRGTKMFATEQGEFRMSPTGFSDLSGMIGFPKAALSKLDDAPDLQHQIMRHLISSGDVGDDPVNIRVTDDVITNILSGGYAHIKNMDVIQHIMDMHSSGDLPQKIEAHSLHVTSRSFSMRIISPDDWNYNVGLNGIDPVYGSMYFRNTEDGTGAFNVGAALARVACFNWTISRSQASIAHKFVGKSEFIAAMNEQAGAIDQYSVAMANEMLNMRSFELERPQAIFEKVIERLGPPLWAIKRGREYFDSETDKASMFDVIQAITFVAQNVSAPTGRRHPNWGLRESMEMHVMDLAQEVVTLGEEGFVSTVGDVIKDLSQFDPETEAEFAILPKEVAGRQVISAL